MGGRRPGPLRFYCKGLSGHDRTCPRTGQGEIPQRKSDVRSFACIGRRIASGGQIKDRAFPIPAMVWLRTQACGHFEAYAEWMKDVPIALEFRHQSWYAPEFREKTLEFMRSEGWIHSIADEPQAGIGSVPVVLETSGTEAVMIRMHGRNADGWHSSGQPNWREVRYLYRYSPEELEQLREWTEQLLKSEAVLDHLQQQFGRRCFRQRQTASSTAGDGHRSRAAAADGLAGRGYFSRINGFKWNPIQELVNEWTNRQKIDANSSVSEIIIIYKGYFRY